MPYRLLVTLLALVTAGHSHGQSPADLGRENLDYYLAQAFAADASTHREALNHIGIDVIADDAGYLVSGVLDGYPAADAGLMRGDRLLEVDGAPYHPVRSFNPTDGTARSGHRYRLAFERNGESRQLTLEAVRENLFDSYRSASSNSIQEFSLGNKVVGYVRLWALSRASQDLLSLRHVIGDLLHTDGIILDLRGSYGFLHADLLHALLGKPPERLAVEGDGAGQATLGDVYFHDLASYRKPIAVLMNARTRGGAEFLAFLLNRESRVISIGDITAGQLGHYRQDGDRVRYNASEMVVDGIRLEGAGVTPQQLMPLPADTSTRADAHFETAINSLLGII